MDYRATPGIFFEYSITTKPYFVYDLLAKILHRSRDVVFREGKRYTAPNTADKAILNEHFYRDVIVEPTPTKKQSEILQPIEKKSTECHTQEPLDDNSPLNSPKPKKTSWELAGIETSIIDAWKLPAKGSCRKCAGKDTLAESPQTALEDEEFVHMIPIYTAAVISDDDNDGIDPMPHEVATVTRLAEKWYTVMQVALDTINQHQVFGDFVELPEWGNDLPNYWVYKI